MHGLIDRIPASEQLRLCGASLSAVKITSFPAQLAVMFITCGLETKVVVTFPDHNHLQA